MTVQIYSGSDSNKYTSNNLETCLLLPFAIKLPIGRLKQNRSYLDLKKLSRIFIFHTVPRMHIIYTDILFYKQPASVLPLDLPNYNIIDAFSWQTWAMICGWKYEHSYALNSDGFWISTSILQCSVTVLRMERQCRAGKVLRNCGLQSDLSISRFQRYPFLVVCVMWSYQKR